MSRIGKQPVTIPAGVTVDVTGNVVKVKGPKGELAQEFDTDAVEVKVADGTVTIDRKTDLRDHRAKHGLYRALINNMVHGCTTGFRKELEIIGVGYSAKVAGNKLTLQIGFCHPVEVEMPKGVSIEAPKPTRLVVEGADKQAVGQIAANIRRIRPPEPYKGKGIRYVDEYVRRKAGKTVAAK